MSSIALNRRLKGQIFSTDLISAVSIFLILLSFIWYTWDDMQYDIDRKLEKNEMEHIAIAASDALVMTSGSPYNWSASPLGTNSIGLANMPRELSAERMAAFSSLSYAQQKEKLGIGARDFWLAIKGSTGAVLSSAGLSPAGDFLVGISRPVIYNSSISSLNFIIWEEYTPGAVAYDAYRRTGG